MTATTTTEHPPRPPLIHITEPRIQDWVRAFLVSADAGEVSQRAGTPRRLHGAAALYGVAHEDLAGFPPKIKDQMRVVLDQMAADHKLSSVKLLRDAIR